MQPSQPKIRGGGQLTWEAYDDAWVKSPGAVRSSVNSGFASCYRGWGSFWVHVRALLKHELKRHIQDFFIIYILLKNKKGLRMNLLRSLHSGLERQEAAWNLWRVPGPLSEPSSPQTRCTWCTPPVWGTGRSPEPTYCHPLQAEHKRMTKQKGGEGGGREAEQYKLSKEAIREILFSLIEFPHENRNNLGYPNILKEINLRAWIPYIAAIMTGRPCWEKTALLSLEIRVIQKNTPNCALTHLTEWAAGRQSMIISQVIAFFFCCSTSPLYGLILTIFWLCLFKRVHQSANCFQHKDNLSHLLSEMKNHKKMTWLEEIKDETEGCEKVKWKEW